jgi:hypothetical protein
MAPSSLELQVGIEVVLGGNCVENEVEAGSASAIQPGSSNTTSSTPKRPASAVFFGDVLNRTTCAPKPWQI